MKCSIMLHFIWVFTICKSTDLGSIDILEYLAIIQNVQSQISYKQVWKQMCSYERGFMLSLLYDGHLQMVNARGRSWLNLCEIEPFSWQPLESTQYILFEICLLHNKSNCIVNRTEHFYEADIAKQYETGSNCSLKSSLLRVHILLPWSKVVETHLKICCWLSVNQL